MRHDEPSSATAELPEIGAPLPTGDQKGPAVRAMFDTIAPRYDLVNRIMTFRLDVRWRRAAIDALGLQAGSRVLDLATGTGDFCRELANRDLRPVGTDFSHGMLSNARTGAPLVQADASQLPTPGSAVDGVTCGFAMRNFVELDQVFSESARVLRPGGRIAFLDASEPDNAVVARVHGLYFGRVVPWIGGLLSDKRAYAYLPRSLAYLPPRPELLAMVRRAGFEDVEHRQLTFGAAQLLTATRADH